MWEEIGGEVWEEGRHFVGLLFLPAGPGLGEQSVRAGGRDGCRRRPASGSAAATWVGELDGDGEQEVRGVLHWCPGAGGEALAPVFLVRLVPGERAGRGRIAPVERQALGGCARIGLLEIQEGRMAQGKGCEPFGRGAQESREGYF